MIKIAVCGPIELAEGDVVSSLERCAAREGIEVQLDVHENPVELIDSCTKAVCEEPHDMLVCAVELAGMTGLHVVSELNTLYGADEYLGMALCSKDAEHAYDAQSLGVNGYLVEPIAREDFDRVIGGLLRDIKRMHAESALVRCRDCVRRIDFSRLSYAETSGHNQVLHHIGRSFTCEMRGSSHDLYEVLREDERFFKLGSSYIVNLDHVARFDMKSGTIVLVDGTAIPVPVRMRKLFERTLYDRGATKATS